jgi:hypothetical protein
LEFGSGSLHGQYDCEWREHICTTSATSTVSDSRISDLSNGSAKYMSASFRANKVNDTRAVMVKGAAKSRKILAVSDIDG